MLWPVANITPKVAKNATGIPTATQKAMRAGKNANKTSNTDRKNSYNNPKPLIPPVGARTMNRNWKHPNTKKSPHRGGKLFWPFKPEKSQSRHSCVEASKNVPSNVSFTTPKRRHNFAESFSCRLSSKHQKVATPSGKVRKTPKNNIFSIICSQNDLFVKISKK